MLKTLDTIILILAFVLMAVGSVMALFRKARGDGKFRGDLSFLPDRWYRWAVDEKPKDSTHAGKL